MQLHLCGNQTKCTVPFHTTKDGRILIPGTHGHLTLQGKGAFTNVVVLRTLRWEDYLAYLHKSSCKRQTGGSKCNKQWITEAEREIVEVRETGRCSASGLKMKNRAISHRMRWEAGKGKRTGSPLEPLEITQCSWYLDLVYNSWCLRQ